jgi:oligosaccharide repeat unit polymerase
MSGNASLVISIFVFVVFAVAVCVYAAIAKRSTITEPIFQFVFFFSLFVLPLPIRACVTQEIEGDVTEHLPQLMPYLPEAVFLSAAGLIFFTWAYYSRVPRRLAYHFPRPRAATRWRGAFLGLGMLALILLILLGRSVGGILSFVLLGYNSTAQMVGKGYLAVGFPWLFVASLFLLYGYALERKRSILIMFVLIFAALLFLNIVMGRREQLVYMGIATFLFWHHAVRNVRLRTVVLAGVMSFLFLNIVGMTRSSSYDDLSSFWSKSAHAWQDTSVSESSLVYTLTTGEFVVPFETLPQMIESLGVTVSPEFGMTYLRAPLQVIPQALFPGRPLPLTNWYMKTFYGSGFDFNENRAFFFLSEGYLNFGVVGVLITMTIWGFFLGSLRVYLVQANGEPGAVLLYVLAVAFIHMAIAGDSTTLLVGLPETYLLAAAGGLYLRKAGGTKRVQSLSAQSVS